MRKLILPLTVFALALFVADYFFRIDVMERFMGFGTFLLDLFWVGRR